MNRIVLIGNGFDLAHGLKTSYNDFLDHYWKYIFQNLKNKAESNLSLEGLFFENYNDYGLPEDCNYSSFVKYCSTYSLKYKFTNDLIEVICKNQSITNWVDLENEYYQLVINSIDNAKIDIVKLNEDFANLKELFVQYLIKCTPDFSKNILNTIYEEYHIKDIARHIYEDIRIRDFTEEAVIQITNRQSEKLFEFVRNPDKHRLNSDMYLETLSYYLRNDENIKNGSIEDFHDVIIKLLVSKDAKVLFDLSPQSILVLNFNYTNTSLLYSNHLAEIDLEDNCKFQYPDINHIHGALNDKENPIIFGFGDELDDNYSEIEKLNNNNYLENIKSIRYSDVDNYKKLLQYINSDQYQICIFGHSCGVSDRTMLNTLFEHENCVSIKPYYHLREDGTDNYSDIVRNISRNFNNKASMRDKVVNKTYCEPLVNPEKNG